MFIAFLTQNDNSQNSGKIFLINKVKDCHVALLLRKCTLGTMTDWEESFNNMKISFGKLNFIVHYPESLYNMRFLHFSRETVSHET